MYDYNDVLIYKVYLHISLALNYRFMIYRELLKIQNCGNAYFVDKREKQRKIWAIAAPQSVQLKGVQSSIYSY